MSPRGATTRLLRPTVALALLALGLVLANDLASRLPWQADLTAGRFFTLSEASDRMLARMDTPVQVELYFSSGRKGVPIGLKVFAQRVEQLLRQYERRSAGKVAVKVVDPAPGTREEEEANRLGLASQPLGPDERLYFGLAVFHGGNHRVIPLVDYRRERLLEYDLSRLIQAVQVHRLPKLAVVSSLEVFGTRGMPKEQQKVEDGSAEWQFIKELRVSYELTEVMPTNETLPADADILLVINPSGFSPRLLHAIDQFILSGGPAVVLLDPYNYHEVLRDQTDGNVIGAEYHKASDLPGFLPGWGVRFSAHEVVGDLAFSTEVPVQDNHPPILFPLWITVPEFDDSQAVTAGFDAVLLAQAGYFAPLPGSPTTFTPLVRSSPRSAPVPTAGMDRQNPYRVADGIRPTGETYALAAKVEGRFRSAFPGGRPPPEAGRGATTDPDSWDLGLKSSRGSSRVILIGDADFLKDEMAYEAVGRRGGALLTRPRNNNVALLVNSLDSLRGSRDMLAITAKGQMVRPFTRIHRMERAAEENFLDQARSINARLAQIDQELTELDRRAAQGGGSIVSENALEAIRRAQKEQDDLRESRAEIRQRLHEAIAALDRRLTWLNLAAVPAAVALGGVGFWLRRMRGRTGR